MSRDVLLVAFALTIFMAVLHIASPLLLRIPKRYQDAVTSFAGGTAIAYVFLHILPDLADGQVAFVNEVSIDFIPAPLIASGIFLIALLGMLVFYGLESWVRVDTGPTQLAYISHVGAYAVLNVVITYTMPARVETGLDFALLFAVAFGLHFLLTDRNLAEAHPTRFSHLTRWILVGALFFGYLLAAVFPPTTELAVAIPVAFLSGSILTSVFREELPDAKVAKFGWFTFGVTVYAVLLLWATAVSG